MKILIPAHEVDPDTQPNEAGEELRRMFFDHTKGYGCYSTFDLNDGVEQLESAPVGGEWNDGIEWRRFRLGDYEMQYYWDGDGVLEFRLPDGSWLCNGDCKKDYVWEHVTAEEHEAD